MEKDNLCEEESQTNKEVKESTEEKEDDLVDVTFASRSGKYDLTLIVEGHRIRVHRMVLCLASPVFEEMLTSDFEKRDKPEIELPGKDYESCKEFLSCIYPDKLKHVTGDNVYKVLPYASEYQVKILEETCEKVILCLDKEIYFANAVQIYRHLQLAEQFNLDKLKERCLYRASDLKLDEMNSASSTHPVSTESVLQIRSLAIQRRDLDQSDDVDVFRYSMICRPEIQKGHPSATVTIEDILEETVKQCNYRSNCKRYFTQARLYKRFWYGNDYNKEKLSRITSFFNALKPKDINKFQEDLKLLPEIVKQKLTFDPHMAMAEGSVKKNL